jgi:hypothetical protein
MVCNTVREGLTPSRLSTANAAKDYIAKTVFRVPRCRWLFTFAEDHDGLVTLGSLIRSPHRVRFTGDPLSRR